MFYIDLEKEYETRFDFLNSYFLKRLQGLPVQGYFVVTGNEFHPELISYGIPEFNNVDFWWIIMWYNNIIDIFGLQEGVRLAYPSIDSVEELYFDLNTIART